MPAIGLLLLAFPSRAQVISASPAFVVSQDWGSGANATLWVTNTSATVTLTNNQLEFDFGPTISPYNNLRIASHSGSHYVFTNESYYPRAVAPGATFHFDMGISPGNLNGTQPTNYLINSLTLGNGGPLLILSTSPLPPGTAGIWYSNAFAAAGGTKPYSWSVAGGSIPTGLNLAASGVLSGVPSPAGTFNFSAQVTDATNGVASLAFVVSIGALPSVSVSDASITRSNAGAIVPGYFHTSGNQIVDASGQPVKLAGVNWFGFETSAYCPHGLGNRGYKSMMDQMVQLGFNTIRLPFCDQMFDPGSTPNGIDTTLNPDLAGLTAVQIMDRIVDYAGQIGLRIFLDHHRSGVGGGPNENGLWYTSAYPENVWSNNWVMLATRYQGNPTVIGADLSNEPHGSATWGDGSANDWRLAAQRGGNAILAVNPNWLIIVEGVESGPSGYYWWGGNLSSAGSSQVQLNVPNRVVYSPHDYCQSVYNQPWFSAANYPDNLPGVWTPNWGYLFQQNIAPVLLGEFGTTYQTTNDQQWLNKLVSYLGGDLNGDGVSDLAPGQLGFSWTFWSWNPDSGDTGGILQADWQSVETAKLAAIQPVQAGLLGGSNSSQSMLFTISLSQASASTVTVQWTTADGSAMQGIDYVGATGTVTFSPGQTSRAIPITILPNNTASGTQTFTLVLTNVTGAGLADGSGLGTIINPGTPSPYQLWRQANFTSSELADPTVSGDAADPDQDNLGNLIEYKLGLNPKAAEPNWAPKLQIETISSQPAATYTYTINTNATDASLTLLESTDCVAWTTATTGLILSTNSAAHEIRKLQIHPGEPLASQLFLRIQVSLAQ